jgi:hypothetical protein
VCLGTYSFRRDQGASLVPVPDRDLGDQYLSLGAERLPFHRNDGVNQTLGELLALVPRKDPFEQSDIDEAASSYRLLAIIQGIAGPWSLCRPAGQRDDATDGPSFTSSL